jgi:hypothetical protein
VNSAGTQSLSERPAILPWIVVHVSWIDATPAALVYDGAGKLIYFGPYSDAARCSPAAGLIEGVLDRALRGEAQHPQRYLGGGCFCGVH